MKVVVVVTLMGDADGGLVMVMLMVVVVVCVGVWGWVVCFREQGQEQAVNTYSEWKIMSIAMQLTGKG
jgi:hypothetical protein